MLPNAQGRCSVLSQTTDTGPAIMLIAVGQTLTLSLGPTEEVERGASFFFFFFF